MNIQTYDLAIAYGVTALAMLAGLLVMRAEARAFWRWPAYSAMAMVLGAVVWILLRKHVLPAEWVITHSTALYYSALTVYAGVGISIGLLLGRLTRRKTPDSDT